jgi:hypothetical protein
MDKVNKLSDSKFIHHRQNALESKDFIVYLFIYDLLNDALSSLNYVSSNGKMINQ